jgi:hypothetical protein
VACFVSFGDPLPIATGMGIVPQPRLPREQQQEQLTRDLENSRLEEARRIIEEYVDDLREIIKKLRQHLH